MYQASDKFPTRMSTAGSTADRMALLERWRQHLKDAKIRYAFAKNYAKEVMDDFRSGGISATTEMFACQKAIRAEVFALREYDRALRIVTDLALNGKIPVEDDPPKCQDRLTGAHPERRSSAAGSGTSSTTASC